MILKNTSKCGNSNYLLLYDVVSIYTRLLYFQEWDKALSVWLFWNRKEYNGAIDIFIEPSLTLKSISLPWFWSWLNSRWYVSTAEVYHWFKDQNKVIYHPLTNKVPKQIKGREGWMKRLWILFSLISSIFGKFQILCWKQTSIFVGKISA